jgi:hypothetical protein
MHSSITVTIICIRSTAAAEKHSPPLQAKITPQTEQAGELVGFDW